MVLDWLERIIYLQTRQADSFPEQFIGKLLTLKPPLVYSNKVRPEDHSKGVAGATQVKSKSTLVSSALALRGLLASTSVATDRDGAHADRVGIFAFGDPSEHFGPMARDTRMGNRRVSPLAPFLGVKGSECFAFYLI